MIFRIEEREVFRLADDPAHGHGMIALDANPVSAIPNRGERPSFDEVNEALAFKGRP